LIANVKKDDANTILDFAEKMFWYLFIMPSEIQSHLGAARSFVLQHCKIWGMVFVL
jgi:hypothetical protein